MIRLIRLFFEQASYMSNRDGQKNFSLSDPNLSIKEIFVQKKQELKYAAG